MEKKIYYRQIASELAVGIIIIVAIAIGAIFYFQNKFSLFNNPAQTVKINYANVKQINDTQINKIIYINDEFGFELFLPKEWEDYKIAKDGNAIRFALPTTDESWIDPYFNNGYAEIFSITSEGIANWTKKCANFCKNDSGALLCGDCPNNFTKSSTVIKKLGVGSKYVYTIHMAQSFPDDFNKFFCENCSTGETYKDVIDKIVNTFKFTK